MITFIHKEDCVGCNACVQRCPKSCISMHEDEQGFLYPNVDLSRCIHCNLCEKVCPVINQAEPRKPIETFAAKNPVEEIRKTSSSGGVFFALAKNIIDEGGVVFGAKFDENWEVIHDYTETLEGLKAFQSSKYVQSRIGETFLQAEKFLKDGRKVMFTGTPCQIAGLQLFLRKDYGEQLLKVDIACHGVPSPMVWRSFLNEIARSHNSSAESIHSINFRDKRFGWQKYGLSIKSRFDNAVKEIYFASFNNNKYMQMYLYNLILRPSCFACPAKSNTSTSDITLSDCWGISKLKTSLDVKNGVSGVILNTCLGINTFSKLPLEYVPISYSSFTIYNSALIKCAVRPLNYDSFWVAYNNHDRKEINRILKSFESSVLTRIKNRLKMLFK